MKLKVTICQRQKIIPLINVNAIHLLNDHNLCNSEIFMNVDGIILISVHVILKQSD